MQATILTDEWFNNFKQEIITGVKNLINPNPVLQPRLKSADVRKMLKCADTKLTTLRKNGTLPFTKVGGTYYYKAEDVERLLNGDN